MTSMILLVKKGHRPKTTHENFSSSSLDCSSSVVSWSGSYSVFLLQCIFPVSFLASPPPPHQSHGQGYNQEPHIQYIFWSLCCHRMNCEQDLKKASRTRVARRVLYIIEAMLRLFVRIANRRGSRGGQILLGKGSRRRCHGSQEGEQGVCLCVYK